MGKLLQKKHFDPHVKDKFAVHTDTEGAVELELFEITEKSTPETEMFSLIFKGPHEKKLAQKTYMMKHPKMGEIELFLVPISYRLFDAAYYQAVFNRLIEKK